jgi:Zn-dependent peptidase ImmA (M78 family)
MAGGLLSLKTDAYFRDIAARALEGIGCVEPPIPVDQIVESMGIPVRPVNLPSFFTGATVYEDGLPVFVINWARPELDRRRATAHMLGHVLLALAGEEDAFPRDSAEHRDAELVARELMLPAAMVIDQARLWFNDYRYLARLFGVDESVMLERLREMGVIRGPQGDSWDY